MAHDISVPIRYECRIAQASFVLGRGQIVGWERRDIVGPPLLKAVACGASDNSQEKVRHKVHGYLDPGDLPKEVIALLPPMVERPRGASRYSSDPIFFDVVIGIFADGPLHERTLDHWAIRDAFLEMKSENVVDFLRRFGSWDANSEPKARRGYEGLLPSEGPAGSFGWKKLIIPVAQVLAERAAIVEALPKGPKHWFENFASPAEFGSRGEFPHYVHIARNCEHAIKTSITVDFLRGVKFGICARPDCRRPFARERKGKIYCQQYCAHLESVRRSRSQ